MFPVTLTRKIRIGNLILRLNADARLSKALIQALKGFKSAGRGKNKVEYSVRILHLDGSSGGSMKDWSYANEFLLNYARKSKYKDLNRAEIGFLIKAFENFRGSRRFAEILKSVRGVWKKGFFMYGLEKKALMLVNSAKRKGYILTTRSPELKNNWRFISYALLELVNCLAMSANSFVFHCSAVKIGKRGYVFIGKSGAGKSTIARLILKNCSQAKIVSDDSALVAFENGDFYAYNVPFYRASLPARRSTHAMHVDHVFFLKKSKKPFVHSLDGYRAAGQLLLNHVNKTWFLGSPLILPPFSLKLFKKCPPKRLAFPKNSSFIRLLGV